MPSPERHRMPGQPVPDSLMLVRQLRDQANMKREQALHVFHDGAFWALFREATELYIRAIHTANDAGLSRELSATVTDHGAFQYVMGLRYNNPELMNGGLMRMRGSVDLLVIDGGNRRITFEALTTLLRFSSLDRMKSRQRRLAFALAESTADRRRVWQSLLGEPLFSMIERRRIKKLRAKVED